MGLIKDLGSLISGIFKLIYNFLRWIMYYVGLFFVNVVCMRKLYNGRKAYLRESKERLESRKSEIY
jgi:hypothetical protein